MLYPFFRVQECFHRQWEQAFVGGGEGGGRDLQTIVVCRCCREASQATISPNYNVKYPKDAHVRSVKIYPVHKIVLQDLCQNLQLHKVLVNK